MNPLHYSVLVTDPLRDGSRAAATSRMEHFGIIANSWPLTIITRCSILNITAALDPPVPPP